MRRLSTATLAAAIALVFANAVQAQVTSSMNSAGIPSFRGPVNATPAPTSAPGTTTATATTAARTGNTTVDVRAQQTQRATAVTHASGSTSSLGSSLGSASVNGTTGTGTTSGTGTGTTPVFGVPRGGVFGTDLTSGSAIASGIGSTAPIYAANDVMGGSSVMLDTSLDSQELATTRANSANVDRAIRAVATDRRRIGRNGQLLQTIAPRTNADLSHQMADDPLPASLTGVNSTIVR